VNEAGTAGPLALALTEGLGLAEALAAVWTTEVLSRANLPSVGCAFAEIPVFAHNEQSATVSAIIRRLVDIIPLAAGFGEELLALESNTFGPQHLVTKYSCFVNCQFATSSVQVL